MTFDLFFEESGEPAPPPTIVSGCWKWKVTAAGPAEYEKRCSGCGQWKPEGEFWKGHRQHLRRPRYSRCILCLKMERCLE